jgi:EAL domain-containing protein (putative c-di-GMP-specific phosphodiesterase class I)
MAEDEDAHEACLLDNSNTIIESTNMNLIGTVITDEQITEQLNDGQRFSRTTQAGNTALYQTFVPVDRPDIAAMIVTFTLDDVVSFQRSLSLYGFLTIIVIYLVILTLLISMFRKERRLRARAYLDTLTGLPNEIFLIEQLDDLSVSRKQSTYHLILIQCQNYDDIFTMHGYSASNEFMSAVSRNLLSLTLGSQKTARKMIFKPKLFELSSPGKTLFRYSNNIFAVLMKDVPIDHITDWLNVVYSVFDSGLMLGDRYHIPVWIKTGIVEIGSLYTDASSILKDALFTIHQVPSVGRTSVFNSLLAEQKKREEILASELRQAIRNADSDQITLLYQPQIDLHTDRITGFEALARFSSPSYGKVSPLEFIAIAERKHLIISLGLLLLKKACSFIKETGDHGFYDTKVAVNISGIQLLAPDFSQQLTAIIVEHGIHAHNLELEITETIFFEDLTQLKSILQKISDLNIPLALDDFGTGYSSLNMLKEIHFDVIKIDRHFIDNIQKQSPDTLLIPDIISMIHKVGSTAVAEGIEQRTQEAFLKEYGCDTAQGYLYGRPMEGKEAIALLHHTGGQLQS